MNAFSKKIMMGLAIIYLLAGTSGCSFVPGKSAASELVPGWPQETVEIRLPAYPAETHPPLAGWQALFLQGGQQKTETLPAGTASIHLSLDKNQPTAVLFYPLTRLQGQHARFFRPAGCVYPYNREASWPAGFTAEILFQLARPMSPEELTTSPVSRFNWPRLTQQVGKLAQRAMDKGAVFSPWFLQVQPLKEAILQGTAATRSIQSRDIQEFPLEEVVMGERLSEDGAGSQDVPGKIYYRYIPLGFIPWKSASATPASGEQGPAETAFHRLAVPRQENYGVHGENAFLVEDKIFTLFARKNQKPALVTTGIERYTERR